MSYGGVPYGSGMYGGSATPPPGLGVAAPAVSVPPVTIDTSLSVQASLSVSIAGGPVLGIFQGKPELINRILEGLDEDMVTMIAEELPRLAAVADIDGSAEQKWGRVTQSAVADEIRSALEPFMEQLQRRQEDMDALFSQVFDMAARATSDDFTTKPSSREVKNWCAVVVLWIMTALGGYWIGSDFHMGVIFGVLGVLAALYFECFR
jgi:hypothetical protein